MPPPVTFILVHPEYAGNIGAAARAIANFGFHRLTVVAPRQPITHRDAQKFAMKGGAVLSQATVVETLDAAIAPLHYCIGTSRRFGKFRRPFLPLAAIDSLLARCRPRERVGILFGPETKGLTNDELARCQAVVTIPTQARCPSMNLAHAVAVVAYTVAQRMGGPPAGQAAPPPPLANQALVNGMFAKCEAALDRLGFFRHGSRAHVAWELRQLFGRTTLTRHEAQMLFAIWQKVLWQCG